MNQGQRYWNEDTQRWEYATTPPAPATAPATAVPARPDAPPPIPPQTAPYAAGAEPGAGPAPAAGPGSGQWPPTVPAPAARQRGTARRALWWKVTAGAAVVGVGAAVAVVELTGPDGSGTVRTVASPAPVTGTPAPTDSSTGGTPTDGVTGDTAASASATASAPPEGYHVVDDPTGFTLAVPDGRQRSERSTGVFYATDGDHRLLQIFVVTEPGMTPYEAVRQSSQNLSRQPGYEEISLERSGPPAGASDGVGDDAARLVYAYDSQKLGERRQVVEYAFTADDGRTYAVLAAGPATLWPQPQREADIALGFFATH